MTAAYSVDTSGVSRGVNCATGYTYVESGARVLLLAVDSELSAGACIRGLRRDVVFNTKSFASTRGDGNWLEDGQIERYPASPESGWI